MAHAHVVLSAPSKCCKHVEFLEYVPASGTRRTAVVTREDDGGGVAVRVWVVAAGVGAHRLVGADGEKPESAGHDLRARDEEVRVELDPKAAYCLWGHNPSAGRTSRIRLELIDA